MVDKARQDKIRREQDLAAGTSSGGSGSGGGGAATQDEDDDDNDDDDTELAAAPTTAGTLPKRSIGGGSGGGGGWLSSKFLPKYLSPGKANKNRAATNPSGDDNSSLASSSLGGSVRSKDSWLKRVRSGASSAIGYDDASLADDFSVGAESIGGKAAPPAFSGADSTLGPMDPERGDVDVDDSVDVTRAYDMSRTETGQSTWSFSRIGWGGGAKKQDPPATGTVATPPRASAGLEVTTDGPQEPQDDMEFAPDTRILTDDDDDDDNVPGGSDFDREFNRKSSDLSHIQRGPGAIQPKGGYRYSARANLPTHAESGPGSVSRHIRIDRGAVAWLELLCCVAHSCTFLSFSLFLYAHIAAASPCPGKFST
jgi:hypothetical protein